MTLDEEFLRGAQAAQMQLERREQDADRARLVYEQAIRRLHAAGGSLRDIAAALGISHQRVHQIVTGGSSTPETVAPARGLRRLRGPRGPRAREAMSTQPAGLHLDRMNRQSAIALGFAQEEAQVLGHTALGTEHLLLGLLRADESLAARLLSILGVELTTTRQAIVSRLGHEPATADPPCRLSPRLKQVFERAWHEAREQRSPHLRTEHLLRGLTYEGNGLASRLLAEQGIGYGQVRARLERADRSCSFCGRSGLEVTHLIAGPGVFVCDGCIMSAQRVVDTPQPMTEPSPLRWVRAEEPAHCSFCGQPCDAVDGLLTGPTASLCTRCLAICRELLDD